MSLDAPPAVATALTLADLTGPGLILPQLRGQDAASVIQELGQALQQEKRIPDLLPFYHAALNREFLGGTDMEAGMAFPHARLPGLPAVSFALGRSGAPLDWGGRSAGAVRLVFLLAVPATDSTQYLLLISGLARLAKDPGHMAQLHAAPGAKEILMVLQQIELRSSSSAHPMKKLGG